jgi:hypothetical protein
MPPARIAVPVALALLVLMAATHIALRVVAPVGYRAAVADPAAYDGQRLVMSLFDVVDVENDGYVISSGGLDVAVEGDAAGLVVGDTVSIGGTFRASDNALIEEWRQGHPRRRMKKLLSVFAIALLLALCPVWFTVRDRRLVERA